MFKQILLLISSLAFVISCGIKGPPLPPFETIDDKINSATIIKSTDNSTAIQK